MTHQKSSMLYVHVCVCVRARTCMPKGQGSWDAPVTVAQGLGNTALGAPSNGCCFLPTQSDADILILRTAMGVTVS